MKFLTEDETLEAAHAGRPVSRFGDGELKLATGRAAKSQEFNSTLQRRLCDVLASPAYGPVVCLPIAWKESPKRAYWEEFHAEKYNRLYRSVGTYGSAFITRPDSAPWINRPAYWQRVIDLWRDRDVVLVRGSEKSLVPSDLPEAKSVFEIVAARQHAWAESDALFQRLKGERRRVIMCLGATATVLSYYLGIEGVHALDLGHIGMFLRKVRRGEPVIKDPS